MDEPPVIDDAPLADPAEVRRAMEFYSSRGWTDGLPVVPVTESYLAEFLATTVAGAVGRGASPMPHLNRALTVRLAAINAALAGCLPAYFPVVLAAWDSFLGDGGVSRAIWQSTTGTAPFTVVNGPVRTAIGLNSRGNLYGLRVPGQRHDRAGDPARLAQRVRAPAARARPGHPGHPGQVLVLHRRERGGLPVGAAARGQRAGGRRQRVHVDRHPVGAAHRGQAHDRPRAAGDRPGRLDLPHRRDGAGVRVGLRGAQPGARAAARQAWLVQAGPEGGDHRARHRGPTGSWRRRARRRSPRAPAGGCPPTTRTRCPQTAPSDLDTPVPILRSVHDVQVVVAGAPNAGVSSVVETFGAVGRPPSVAKVEEKEYKARGASYQPGAGRRRPILRFCPNGPGSTG